MAHYIHKLALLCLVVLLATPCKSHSIARKLGNNLNSSHEIIKESRAEETHEEGKQETHSSKEAVLDEEVENSHAHDHHHRGFMDNSIVGVGVVLGGLATIFSVAIFCYIRATARHNKYDDTSLTRTSPSTSTPSVPSSPSPTIV